VFTDRNGDIHQFHQQKSGISPNKNRISPAKNGISSTGVQKPRKWMARNRETAKMAMVSTEIQEKHDTGWFSSFLQRDLWAVWEEHLLESLLSGNQSWQYKITPPKLMEVEWGTHRRTKFRGFSSKPCLIGGQVIRHDNGPWLISRQFSQ